MTFYDLSHGFDEDTYHPFGFAHFQNVQMFPSHGCRHAVVTMSLHFATHMDAPWHMVETGKLIGEAVIIDVSETYAPDKGSSREISLHDVQSSLSAHQEELRKGDALLVHTGWTALFKTEPARYYAGYPTPSRAVCEWAVETGGPPLRNRRAGKSPTLRQSVEKEPLRQSVRSNPPRGRRRRRPRRSPRA